MLDVDNSDSIEIDEIKIGLATINIFMNDAELKQILTKIDEGHEGITDLTDFIYFLDLLRKQLKMKRDGKENTSVRNSPRGSIAEAHEPETEENTSN